MRNSIVTSLLLLIALPATAQERMRVEPVRPSYLTPVTIVIRELSLGGPLRPCGLAGISGPVISGQFIDFDARSFGPCVPPFDGLIDYHRQVGLLAPGTYTARLFVSVGASRGLSESLNFEVSAVERPFYPIAVHPSLQPTTAQPVTVTVTHPVCSPLTAVTRGGGLRAGELFDLRFTAPECTGALTQTVYSPGLLQGGYKYFRLFDSAGQLIQLEDFLVFSAAGAPPYPVSLAPANPNDCTPVTLTVRHAGCPAFSGFVRNDRVIDITLPSAACAPFDNSVVTTAFDLGLLPAGSYTVRFVSGTPATPYQTVTFAIEGQEPIPALGTSGLLALFLALAIAAVFALRR